MNRMSYAGQEFLVRREGAGEGVSGRALSKSPPCLFISIQLAVGAGMPRHSGDPVTVPFEHQPSQMYFLNSKLIYLALNKLMNR